jgi:hypothetical protein
MINNAPVRAAAVSVSFQQIGGEAALLAEQSHQLVEGRRAEALRRHEEHLDVSLEDVLAQEHRALTGESAAETGPRQRHGQLLELVVHERDERRDHHR